MSQQLLPITAANHAPHALHASERIWTETNCYVDLWIELLHALDVDPIAAAAFTLSTDFEGDQWTFFKYPPEDLRAVYGIEVAELNVWRPMIHHAREQLNFNRLLTVEVDSWFLPDTHGVSYQIAHTKSTIVPNLIDEQARRLGYFHNAGYFELDGDDFDGIFRLGKYASEPGLPPYVETIKLDDIRRPDDAGLTELAVASMRDHLARLPATNPIKRMGEQIVHDLPWLRDEELETFHLYAFGTCRQCGASAELAADFLDWLAIRVPKASGPLHTSSASWREVATTAKSLQFSLARAARGRDVDLASLFATMSASWEDAVAALRGIDFELTWSP